MVPEKEAPLATVGNLWSLLEYFDDRLAVLELYGHEHSWHEREMERHVKLVGLAEVQTNIRGPLICLG